MSTEGRSFTLNTSKSKQNQLLPPMG
jgi:hypothetical protein